MKPANDNNARTSRALRRLADYDQSETIPLPSWTDKFANVWDPVTVYDQPFFWYIGKAGGGTLEKLFSFCLGLVSASHKGEKNNDPIGAYLHDDGGLYLNAKTDSPEEIDVARQMGLVGSGLADVVVSQHLTYASYMFDATHRARAFVMLRHPVKRAIDQFYYRQHATWESSFDPELAGMSLSQYSLSNKFVENYEVRSLLQITDSRPITADHVALAKEILRRKFVVGIFEWFDITVVRFEKYFGWWDTKNVLTNLETNRCHFENIREGDHIGNHPKVDTEGPTYNNILVRNWADVELYHYAKSLFHEQADLVN